MGIFDYGKRKVIIEITEGEERKPGDEGEPLGMLPTWALPPIRGRRRLKKDSKIYAKLWDLGQLAGGADLPFVHNHPPTLNIGVSYSINNDIDFVAAYNALILGYGIESWRDTFTRITNPYRYGVTVNNISGNVTEADADKGFELIGEAGLTVGGGGKAIQYFDTYQTDYFKITSTPSFDGEEVELIIDKDIEVYLMPMVMRHLGRADVNTPPPYEYEYPKYEYLLNLMYKPMSRVEFLNNPILDAVAGQPFFKWGQNQSVASLPLRPKVFRDEWHRIATQDPDSFMYVVRYNGAFFFKNYEAHTVEAPGGFPQAETPNVEVNPNGDPETYRPLYWIYNFTMMGELLLGAIKMGEDWFFVWSRFEYPGFSVQGYMIAT